MAARLRQLRSDQAGFTLPELMASITIGMIVLLAAFMLLDRAVQGSNKLADRQDAAQRGRLAMEVVTRDLRSQVCLGDSGEPITAGSDKDRVTFYANLSANPDAADRRSFRYVSSEKRLYQDIEPGSGTFPDLTFSGGQTHIVLQPVIPVKDAGVDRDIFRYYRYKAGGAPGELEQLTSPLDAAEAEQVVMIKTAFVAMPTRVTERTTDVVDAATFESDIYVRLADPSKPTEGPRCL